LLTALPGDCTATEPWTGGAVAADHPLAAEAGREILEAGGNAVDAAVAVSFALSVVRPYSCGLGGGGFMVVRLVDDPRTGALDPVATAVDYRERAPTGLRPDTFEALHDAEASRYSGLAVGVPGSVAGLLFALDRYGTMDRDAVLAPAIRLAEAGFTVDDHYLQAAATLEEAFAADASLATSRRFLWERFLKRGRVAPGDRIRLPEQAAALRRIADHGAAGFYRGPIAEAIVRAVSAAGGVLTGGDLAGFRVEAVPPLLGTFRSDTLYTMPPPSSGGLTTLQILGILERYGRTRGPDLASLDFNGAAYVHRVAEAMKHAFADRAAWLGDPDFCDIPLARLLSPAYLEEKASRIDPDRTLPPERYGSRPPPVEDHGTSHVSVVDAAGNAVALTETINLEFGSRIAVDDYGFMLNNEMDDFTTRRGGENAFGLRQSERNLPAPGKRPLSSMSPTIAVAPDGTVDLVVGASGGPRIISAVVQVILDTVVFEMPAEAAVAAPRFHHQWWPEKLFLEASWSDWPTSGRSVHEGDPSLTALLRGLRRRGHTLGTRETIGVVQLLRRSGHGYTGAADPRKGGRAVGIR